MVKIGYQILIIFFIVFADCSIWRVEAQIAPISFPVGVILDFQTPIGTVSNKCLSMAIQDFYAVNDHYRTRVVLHAKDSKDVSGAVISAMELLEEVGVQAIVGPQTSAEAEFVADLGNKHQVPVVSFSATSPSISRSQMPYFVRMTQNDTYQLEAISSIIQEFRWKDVILVYEDSDYGNVIIPAMIEALESIHVRIPYKRWISPLATEHQIHEELLNLAAMQTKVFLVHMSAPLGCRFFPKAKEIGLLTEGNAWIITEEMTSALGSMDFDVLDSMRGTLGIKPYIPKSKELEYFRDRMFINNETGDDSNIFCLRAYDTFWALAMAAERVVTNYASEKLEQHKNISDVTELGISGTGHKLLEEILSSKFKGLTGEIEFIDGQLQRLAFQIINVVSKGEKEIGFWIPLVGLSVKSDGTSQSNLQPVIWPGDSPMVPKGWVVPSNGKKVKVGVLMKGTFTEFVNISRDGKSVSGYCIDVFKAVMEALPYAYPYEFFPITNIKSEGEENYNDLLEQVFVEKHDVVVGDITITASRSLLVDFSLPYTTGGVAMLVPIKYHKKQNLMIVFEPFSRNLWLSYFAIFAVTVITIWCFEFLIVSDLPSVKQIAKIPTVAWTVLTVTTFNQIDGLKKASNFVALVFALTNLILVGLFTQQLTTVLFDYTGKLVDVKIKDLIKNGEFVGYQKNSYTETVMKQLKFDESQLKAYNSPEEYDEALQKGSQNGGVAAIFDEIPYIKLLLNKYCGKYRRAGPLYRMEGFGFVFPRGSPLVGDVSKAISLLLEEEKITQIERVWLESEKRCPEPPESLSKSLSLDKIWGLLVADFLFICSPLVLFIVAHMNKKSQNKLLVLLRYTFQIVPDRNTMSEQ